jgi:hypothetical protein
MLESERLYGEAAKVADVLLRDGVPVLGFGSLGGKLSMTFQLVDERAVYVALLPEAEATPERFRELYEAVA